MEKKLCQFHSKDNEFNNKIYSLLLSKTRSQILCTPSGKLKYIYIYICMKCTPNHSISKTYYNDTQFSSLVKTTKILIYQKNLLPHFQEKCFKTPKKCAICTPLKQRNAHCMIFPVPVTKACVDIIAIGGSSQMYQPSVHSASTLHTRRLLPRPEWRWIHILHVPDREM